MYVGPMCVRAMVVVVMASAVVVLVFSVNLPRYVLVNYIESKYFLQLK